MEICALICILDNVSGQKSKRSLLNSLENYCIVTLLNYYNYHALSIDRLLIVKQDLSYFDFNIKNTNRMYLLMFLQEFVMGLSVLSRGTLQERLQWAFNLYDINGDGFITKDEMTDIVSAIYEMMGRFSEPMVDENTTKEHVERVFHVSSIQFLCTQNTALCYVVQNNFI